MQENPTEIDRLNSTSNDHARKFSRVLLLMAASPVLPGLAALAAGKTVPALVLFGLCGLLVLLLVLASAGFAWLARR